MKGWKNNLGGVETIYEEEYEFSSSSSSSPLSPSPSSPPTPLNSRVQKWSLAVGRRTEVLIRVGSKCFHLHKDPLTSRSTYLKRLLTDSVTELTLSPPLNISAETFTLVADFCYGAVPVITPFNLAALSTASELLEMTEVDGEGDRSLAHLTDAYFRQVVAVKPEYASIVFRSSLSLLPEAETAARLVSRCVEALGLTDVDGVNDDGVSVDVFEDVIVTVCPEDFHLVAEAMQRRFNNHDVVYRIVDLYIRRHGGKITEEQKTQIASTVDCTKLSAELLLDAVQNPSMPLRFVVGAMLVQQLHTRRHVITATATATATVAPSPPPPAETLGALLQREAALRQSIQLKSTLEATALRVRTLERELSAMKKLLLLRGGGGDGDGDGERSVAAGGGRSASMRLEREVTKYDRLSSSLRLAPNTSNTNSTTAAASSVGPTRSSKRFGQGLISGIKKAFGVRTNAATTATTNSDRNRGFGGKDDRRAVASRRNSNDNDSNDIIEARDDDDDDDRAWEYSNKDEDFEV